MSNLKSVPEHLKSIVAEAVESIEGVELVSIEQFGARSYQFTYTYGELAYTVALGVEFHLEPLPEHRARQVAQVVSLIHQFTPATLEQE